MCFAIGTFQAEKEEKVVYGLVHPLSSWDPLYTQVVKEFSFYFGPYTSTHTPMLLFVGSLAWNEKLLSL